MIHIKIRYFNNSILEIKKLSTIIILKYLSPDLSTSCIFRPLLQRIVGAFELSTLELVEVDCFNNINLLSGKFSFAMLLLDLSATFMDQS